MTGWPRSPPTARPSAIPLIMLSAGAADEDIREADRQRFNAIHEREASARSRRAEQRIIAGANHYTIVMQQGFAKTVAEEIRQLVVAQPGGR